MAEKLKALMDRMKQSSFSRSRYDGLAGVIAFELATLDSFLDAILNAFVAGELPPEDTHAEIQDGSQLTGTRWYSEAEGPVELADLPELLAHAQLLEDIREACAARLRN